MTSLTVRGLTKSFDAVKALDGVDLTVPTGQVCAVLGPSGCGKSTLIRLVAGFDRPDAGQVRLADTPLVDDRVWVPAERRGITVVPQDGALFPHLSVGSNIAFGLKGPKRLRAVRVAELLDLVGLTGLAERNPAQLSGGQQQRVALARALAPKPQLILLDEPFSALDAGLRAQVRSDVREVLRLTSATALLVTHDQAEALSMADTLVVMAAGEVLMQGTPQEVYRAPTSLAVARFVGNLVEVPGEVVDDDALTIFGRHEFQTRQAPAAKHGTVCFRPEQLVFDPEGREATVISREYLGPTVRITMEVPLPTGPLTVTAVAPGDLADMAVAYLRVSGPVGFFPN